MAGRSGGSEAASIDAALEGLRKRFDGEAARGLGIAYQFELAGPGGGAFYARVDDGRLETGVGSLPAVDVCFALAAADFFAILAGRANPDMLFMEDRIEVKGDLSLALKVRRLFPPHG